eukprot:COSAG02_NODE_104_length_36421_cov_132.465420_11_plen_126_part_00
MQPPLQNDGPDGKDGSYTHTGNAENPLFDVESASNEKPALTSSSAAKVDDLRSRETVARFTEAPANWHQTVVFMVTTDEPEDASMKDRVPLQFAISALMVMSQARAHGLSRLRLSVEIAVLIVSP